MRRLIIGVVLVSGALMLVAIGLAFHYHHSPQKTTVSFVITSKDNGEVIPKAFFNYSVGEKEDSWYFRHYLNNPLKTGSIFSLELKPGYYDFDFSAPGYFPLDDNFMINQDGSVTVCNGHMTIDNTHPIEVTMLPSPSPKSDNGTPFIAVSQIQCSS